VRAHVAEFIGTFALVFAGCGAIAVGKLPDTGIALAFGLVIAVRRPPFRTAGLFPADSLRSPVSDPLAADDPARVLGQLSRRIWMKRSWAGARYGTFRVELMLWSIGGRVDDR
jgi:hypothetical protein